ncbi:HalOD1 output domain-containing protein [Halobaculum marinum]|uniref:HalOD1 output domain-containing protein n=1 Tax=Halobaculum marinum TaxID=3031996 RepID=A0ABD5WZN0_9EURY|nr:HalOD1 output domain-containing protein [Halobaculum sp. DT55]
MSEEYSARTRSGEGLGSSDLEDDGAPTVGSRDTAAAVVAAVATDRGETAVDLPAALYDTVDPDALDALFTGGRGHVQFEYADRVVTVDHERTVTVESVE